MPIALVSVAPSFRTYACISVGIYILYIALSSYYEDFSNFNEFLQHQYEHFWTDIFLLNLLACAAVQIGCWMQYLLFGQLRAIEEQNIRDKINHFGLYKFVFLFGVLNLGEVGLVTKWAVWCSVLGAICVLDTLCQDRAQYLSLTPNTRIRHHRSGMILTGVLHLITILLMVLVLVTHDDSHHITCFLLADVFLFYLMTLKSLTNYGLIVYEMYVERWENKDVTRYYVELCFEVVMLTIELLHNIHMLVFSGVLLSMGSFVLCMHIKHIYNEIRKRWLRHKNFRSILESLDEQFRVATSEELEANNDHCAICWESMDTARKLPCGHLFHISCLRSWLEHDTSCPTCRHALSHPNQATPAAQPPQRNMAWQFRGSRWASWLPNFSVHVIRSPQHIDLDILRPAAPPPPPPPPPQQPDVNPRIVAQVQEVLPHVPRLVIENDLRRTGNSLLTIENLLQLEQPEDEHYSEETGQEAVETVQLTPREEVDAILRRRQVLAATERRLESHDD